jgi:hypothetical protein
VSGFAALDWKPSGAWTAADPFLCHRHFKHKKIANPVPRLQFGAPEPSQEDDAHPELDFVLYAIFWFD